MPTACWRRWISLASTRPSWFRASTVFGHDNSYVADSVAQHRDRFVGVFSVDVLAADGLDQMKRWLDAGLSGLRLFTTGTTMPGQATWLDDPRSFPVWHFAEANEVPVCLQMTAEGIPMLRVLLDKFPRKFASCSTTSLGQSSAMDRLMRLQRICSILPPVPGVHLKLTNRTLATAAEGASTPRASRRRSC